MKLSVLMPVYNAEDYLIEAIDSVLNQTYRDFEFIIIDDGSQDGSSHIIKSYSDPRIKYLRNETNLRISKALNKGIALAGGKYIARMDADDVCHPQRFEQQLTYLEKHPEIDIVGSWTCNFSDNFRYYNKTKTKPEQIKVKTLFGSPFIHPSVMGKAAIFKAYKYSPDFVPSEDYEFWNRLTFHKEVVAANLPSYLLNYRATPSIHKRGYNLRSQLNKIIYKRTFKHLFNYKMSEREQSIHLKLIYPMTSIQPEISLLEVLNWSEKILKLNRQFKKFSSFILDEELIQNLFYFVYHNPSPNNVISYILTSRTMLLNEPLMSFKLLLKLIIGRKN